ncbi:TPA: hypothetical protein DEO28_02185 [Candidatus Dependentiae bacterium]|nr:MAG: hypothetical protein UR14_C0009G0016 [candidate division TM6 bacterium GW2011_GWE2_31_21]KKP52543.1 MAG: hypothetical protein UR43_C0012G0012 [candidate division TM6 bacterium GW2011_GWF2_33_332]HBS48449.1 hypothetical protein [Candidatus Dependentiae bacterium]HBZ73298.1 hypothetical protein [Candidatus Dependentiae bacterium]
MLSNVENIFLEKSGRKLNYPNEKIPVIEVENSLELGKLVALRFIEWVLQNPNGVISLPTGKTPLTFIKQLDHYKKNWNDSTVSAELKYFGISNKTFPDTSSLKFVQMDEYFPIETNDKNSFSSYVEKNYISILQIKPENCLKMIFPKEMLENPTSDSIEKFCTDYEEKIKNFGGINFFLGGIGPDGHIAFNMKNSSFDSKTRLITLNYESAAVAAGDFGGMSHCRNKQAITIGLNTITANKNATIIIFASGKLKAPIVKKAIEEKQSIESPASIFQNNPNAKFYLNKDAASNLYFRRAEYIKNIPNLENHPQIIDEIIFEQSKNCHKNVDELTKTDFETTEKGKFLISKFDSKLPDILQDSKNRLIEKIKLGQKQLKGLKILHTSPHPDDEMLGYFPHILDLLKDNENYFAYFTNGYRAIANSYLETLANDIDLNFIETNKSLIFDLPYEKTLEIFKNSFLKNTQNLDFDKLILSRFLAETFEINCANKLIEKIVWLKNDYLKSAKPGYADTPEIQILKGKIRQSEVDRMWFNLNVPLSHIFHLKSKFYTPDYSAKPLDDDIKPILDLINKIKPDIISFAFDPQGTGPDTHFKVLQIINKALEIKQTEQKGFPKFVWCYRNVWYKFNLFDNDLAIIPATANQLKLMDYTFKKSFSTQTSAEFPSQFHDGPFSELSCKIQHEQFNLLKDLLGEENLINLFDNKLQNISGMIFMKQMSLEEYLKVK